MCLLGFSMEYVEAYASRAGFVLPSDGKILWAHPVRFHPMLQHVTRSRGWNITERVNDNIGNEIELGMEIRQSSLGYCKYRRNKGNRTSTFTVQR
jgi:hypothetical protein